MRVVKEAAAGSRSRTTLLQLSNRGENSSRLPTRRLLTSTSSLPRSTTHTLCLLCDAVPSQQLYRISDVLESFWQYGRVGVEGC